jgi:pectin methylesterase-like acyl-CoA thioesterase
MMTRLPFGICSTASSGFMSSKRPKPHTTAYASTKPAKAPAPASPAGNREFKKRYLPGASLTAIVKASGNSVALPAGQFESVTTATLPGIGIPVRFAVWFDTATRTTWGCLDCMFGCAVADATQAELLITA